jgi:hypothetical protein
MSLKYVSVHLKDGTIVLHHSVESVEVYTDNMVVLNRAQGSKRYDDVARLMVREQGRRLGS